MSFLGQINFGYPLTAPNIITTVPDNAVVPLSIGSSLQGNILGVTFGDLKSQVSSPLYDNDGNTFIGENVFNNIVNVNKNQNTAIGQNALKNNIGQQNIGIGVDTLYDNTTGFQNIAVGNGTLFNNTSGENNIGLGVGAMGFNTTGINNIAIGTLSLLYNTTGRDNIAIGVSTGNGNTTGQYNIMIGSDIDNNNFSRCVILGKQAQATADNQFVVGSVATPAGSVTTEVNTSSRVWNVRINGVARKILLA